VVCDGDSGGREGSSICLSGFERSSPPTEAAGGETRCSLQKHRETGRRCVLGAIVPLSPDIYEPGVYKQIAHPPVLLANFVEYLKFSHSKGPHRPMEDSSDTSAIRLELTSTSIYDGIFCQGVEGPGSPCA